MTEWDDQLVILRLGLFHEADLWLRVLSRRQGLITVFAFGGAKSRHRFCGCLDKFNTLQCRIKAGRTGYLTLEEASLTTGPRLLRKDWRKMGIAANCIHFMEAMRIDADSAGQAFDLMEDLRETLENGSRVIRLFPLFFRLRLASLLGFAPDFDKCAICGHTGREERLFVPEEGQVFCPSCEARLDPRQKRHGLRLSSDPLARLGQIRTGLPSSWQEDDLSERDKRACGRAIDCFIRYHLGLAWENGTFRAV